MIDLAAYADEMEWPVGEPYLFPIGPDTLETYAAELELRQARADYRATWDASPYDPNAERFAFDYVATASAAYNATWFREW